MLEFISKQPACAGGKIARPLMRPKDERRLGRHVVDTEYSAFSSVHSMLRLQRLPADPVSPAGPVQADMAAFFAGQEARRVLAAASLERSRPELLDSLTRLAAEAEPLLPDMEEVLDELKERFLDMLRVYLARAGVDTENTRLVVGLDAAGRFGVVDQASEACRFPDAQDAPDASDASDATAAPDAITALDALLSAAPELAAVLREIARQSLLLRGLQDIGAAVARGESAGMGSESSGDDGNGGLGVCPYHVCLRGALSHFYFPAR